MLTIAYAETYQVTKDPFYKKVVEEILEYVQRDMTSEEGGFHSAKDADSEGEEGRFYVWSYDELKEILGEDFDIISKVFNVTEEGNYREEATGRLTGKNILYMKKTLDELAEELKMPLEELEEIVNRARKKLFEVREKRVHPLKDTKILTDWNGLMIAAFSIAGQVLDREEYVETAKKAADFILEKMKTEKGFLLHRYKDGEAKFEGKLDDYAFLTWGLIELYNASFEEKYLKESVQLTEKMIKHFWDEKDGGFFMTPDFIEEELIIRPKESYDGAIPSGNSVAAYNLFRLFRLTGNKKYEEYGLKTINAFADKIESLLTSYSMMLVAFDFYISEGIDIVLTGGDIDSFVKTINSRFLPHKTLLYKKDDTLSKIAFFTKDIPVSKETKAYICKNFTCGMPVDNVEKLEKELD